ncbi:hypothetical protein ACX80E_06295 [Arthrobacter sp. TMN-49]
MSAGVAGVVPRAVREVIAVDRPATWRGTPFRVSYIYVDRDVSGTELVDIYRWAARQHFDSPRVISPFSLQWSSVFHPRFYHAAVRSGVTAGDALVPTQGTGSEAALQRLWVESVMFLASVTVRRHSPIAL